MRPLSLSGLVIIGGLALMAVARSALAESFSGEHAAASIDEATVDKASAFKISDTVNVVVLPIPLSNPTIGTGLSIAGVLFYQMDEASAPSYTGIGGLYANSDSWAAGIVESLSFHGDRYRLNLPLGYGSFNYSFFGVGSTAGEVGASVPITQQGYMLKPQFQVRVADNLYAGANYRLVRVATSVHSEARGSPLDALLDRETSVVSSSVGLVMSYDTRNNKFTPSAGENIEGEFSFAHATFLSDMDYRTFTLAYNRFDAINPRAVLASRAVGCYIDGDAPLFDLCLFGSKNDLRGYESGRFRDKTMLAAQTEYRWQAFERFGFVGFVGIGAVAPELNGYTLDDLQASAGVGARFLASRDYGVNIGIDLAITKDGDGALYFRIGEAF